MASYHYPTLSHLDMHLGNVSGASFGNKWGYNADIDIGTEVVAAFGGTYVPPTTAYTLNIVSSSVEDDAEQTGAYTLIVYGIDGNGNAIQEFVTLDGQTPVTTTNTYFGVNRMVVYSSGSTNANVGVITATHSTGGAVQATIPAGASVTQQCIFHTPTGFKGFVHTVELNGTKTAGGVNPVVIFKIWQYSRVTGSKYEVFRHYFDTALASHADDRADALFEMDGQTTTWIEATTDKDDTEVAVRFGYTLLQL